MKKLVILGAGGHGRVTAEAAEAQGMAVAGFLAPGAKPGDLVLDWPILGDDTLLDDPAFLAEHALALGLGDNRRRLALSLELAARGADLPAILHPSARISKSARIDPGALVCAGALVNSLAHLEAASIANTGAVIEHDCRLGPGSQVASGAVLAGAVQLGARVFVGAGATVLPGRVLGEDAIVGGGAVVTKDVAPGHTVVGVPARPLPASL